VIDEIPEFEELSDELKLVVVEGTKHAKPNGLAQINAFQW
jgi:hypothetical protein